MKGYRRILWKGPYLLCIGGLLFAFPEESLKRPGRASRCVWMCSSPLFSLFCALFPAHRNRWLGSVPVPCPGGCILFGVGGAGAAALVLGLIEGIQLGARTISPSWWSAGNAAERHAASRFCNNCGPALFLNKEWGSLALRRWGSFSWEPIWGRAVLLGVFARWETHR